MIVYRITLAKHTGKLTASGNAARWNSKNISIIYTASSRSLACLENVVHRSSRGLQENFRTVIIEIPNSLKILMIDKKDLIREWKQFGIMPYTQSMGDKWVKEAVSPVLRVPSVIIPEEYNYLLNTSHKDFSKIKHLGSEPFTFDNRLKQ